MLTPPKNPAGELATQANPDRATREREIATIQELPNRLRQLLTGLTDDQLDTKYVNWSIRQIVNHLSDSHMNGFIRLKLALTEDEPTIKPYRQGEFAETAEAATGSLEPTLQLLTGLHDRWVRLLQVLTRPLGRVASCIPKATSVTRLANHLWSTAGTADTTAPKSNGSRPTGCKTTNDHLLLPTTVVADGLSHGHAASRGKLMLVPSHSLSMASR